MTREIKFRAWDAKENKMSEVMCGFGDMVATEFGSFNGLEDYEVGVNIFPMQYTGLKDMAGKEIYEGDVITYRCPECIEEHRAEIMWIDEVACWGIADHQQQVRNPLSQPTADKTGIGLISIERTIGNIYENPELIEEDKPTEQGTS